MTNDIKELAQHHDHQQQNITDLQLEDLPDIQPNLINKLKKKEDKNINTKNNNNANKHSSNLEEQFLQTCLECIF